VFADDAAPNEISPTNINDSNEPNKRKQLLGVQSLVGKNAMKFCKLNFVLVFTKLIIH
jgi:hypothetical protein